MKNWTEEPPTKPGKYWIISPYVNVPRVISIWQYDSSELGEGLFTNEDGGASLKDRMLYPKGTLYSKEPITPPEMI